MSKLRLLFTLAMLATVAATLSACNTVGRWSRDEYSQVEDTWENAQRGTQAAARVKPPSANPDAGYKIGQKVKHAVFGQGVVIGSVGDGEDAQITVAFPKVGVKKLVAGFARLEKV